jgi:Ca2+/Na+ antiporter
VEPEFLHIQGPVMLGMLIVFRIFVWTTRGHFRRWQGIVFLAGYAAFVIAQYLHGRY